MTEDMTESELSSYAIDRLRDQIDWYESKSAMNKRWHYGAWVWLTVSAMTIPVIVSVGFISQAAEVCFALLGVILVWMWVGMRMRLCGWYGNWQDYRATAESLKKEQHLLFGRAGAYAESDRPHSLFVERCESLISTRHSKPFTTP